MGSTVLPQTSRAYGLLELKAVDDDARVIEGIASNIEPDRVGDIVEPKGAIFKLPLPLLWQHKRDEPIGQVTAAKITAKGIEIRAEIAKNVLPRIDEAWTLIKAGLVRGLSIGYLVKEADQIRGTFGSHLKSWEWLELSVVTVPANADTNISLVKSLDAPFLAETGESVRSNPPGDTGTRVVRIGPTKAPSMQKTYQEQITALEATRAAKAAELEGVQNKASDEGRTKDQTERETFATLKTEIESIDAEIKDLREMEKMNLQKAAPAAGDTTKAASDSRGGVRQVSVVDSLPKGIGFARAVKANLVARLDGRNPVEVAKEMYPSDDRLHKHLLFVQNVPNIIMQLKAAVPGATTLNSLWAGALTDPTNLPGEFVEFLRPATIIGRLNLRNIPTNVRLIEQTQGGSGYWVGQGAPKPLTAFGYAPITLSPTKVAAISVATEESLRYSSPSLDTLIRDGLRDALVERVDRDLLDPAEAGTANIQPASLTNGLSAMNSAGTSADNIRTDIASLVATFRGNNLRGPIVLVMPDSLAVAAAFMATSLGTAEFPELNADGGSIRGIRVITSEYLANQSGGGNMVVAIAEREVFRSDDGGVRVDASREASLQMLDNPTNNAATGAPTTMVSMWQTNSVAFRGEWFINWQKRRSTAVAYMDDVNWGSIGSP